jgi:hypothetical protein
MLAPTAHAHTGAIYVTLDGQPGLIENRRTRDIARGWLARLNALESRLEPENLELLGARLETPRFDAVPKETLVANRDGLLAEIAAARAYFQAVIDH